MVWNYYAGIFIIQIYLVLWSRPILHLLLHCSLLAFCIDLLFHSELVLDCVAYEFPNILGMQFMFDYNLYRLCIISFIVLQVETSLE